MHILKVLFGLGTAYLVIENASAQAIHTDFLCDPLPAHNPLASAICHNTAAAAAEFQFSRVYYALRNKVGKSGYQKLKFEVLQDDHALNQQCSIPEPGQSDRPLTDEQTDCYVTNQDALTARYSSRLSQGALEETRRPVEQHIEAQNRLIALGYLKGVTSADGVYGDSTRSAIVRWQEDHNITPIDGFVSDESFSALTGPPTAQDDAFAQKIHELAQVPDTSHSNAVVSDMPPQVPDAPSKADENNHSIGQLCIIVVLISIVGIYILIRLGRRRHFEDILSNVRNEIESQKRNLQITRSQKITRDMYGTVITHAWEKEVLYFINTRINPIVLAGHLSPLQQSQVKQEALVMIESLSSHPLQVSAVTPKYNSSPTVFDPRMDPFHYEQYCALLLKTAGWEAHATQKTGDQGADVIATKHGVKVVIQCKLYSGTVGNDSVQQVFTAQRYQGAQGALVVSNSTFSQSARQAASSTGVSLVHHTQLVDAAAEILFRADSLLPS